MTAAARRGELSVGDLVRYEGREWLVLSVLPFPVYGWVACTIWRLDSGDRHVRDIDLDDAP